MALGWVWVGATILYLVINEVQQELWFPSGLKKKGQISMSIY